jgi:hypothetical protein
MKQKYILFSSSKLFQKSFYKFHIKKIKYYNIDLNSFNRVLIEF